MELRDFTIACKIFMWLIHKQTHTHTHTHTHTYSFIPSHSIALWWDRYLQISTQMWSCLKSIRDTNVELGKVDSRHKKGGECQEGFLLHESLFNGLLRSVPSLHPSNPKTTQVGRTHKYQSAMARFSSRVSNLNRLKRLKPKLNRTDHTWNTYTCKHYTVTTHENVSLSVPPMPYLLALSHWEWSLY